MAKLIVVIMVLGLTVEAHSQTLEQRAQVVLQTYCYECHGQRREGDPNFNVTDYNYLTKRKPSLVVARSVERSRIMQRIEAGEMPPEDRPQPTQEEVGLLHRWISEGAKSWDEGERRFVGNRYVGAMIGMDVMGLGRQEAQHMRYLSLANLYNDGVSEKEIARTRDAVTKVLNSIVSIREVERIQPKPVVPLDELGLVLRVDLRDYRLTPDDWRNVISEYQKHYHDGTSYMRGDAFCWLVTRGDLYYRLLDVPLKERQFEQVIGARQPEKQVWAGVADSSVSIHNRLLVRRDSRFGYYWKGLNVVDEERDGKDIFTDSTDFQRDYTVAVFPLANGYPGFVSFINDKNIFDGDRVNEVDPAAESDPTRLAGEGGKVLVGQSCIGCHTFGVVPNVRDVVRTGAIGTPNQLAVVNQRFPAQDELDRILEQDKQSYRSVHGQGEPFRGMIERFNRPVDLHRAAVESGTQPNILSNLIRQRQDVQLMGLVPLLEGKTVTRKAWQSGPARKVAQLVKENGL